MGGPPGGRGFSASTASIHTHAYCSVPASSCTGPAQGEHLEGVAHLQDNGFSASNGTSTGPDQMVLNAMGIEDGVAAPCSSHSSGEQEPMLQASAATAAVA